MSAIAHGLVEQSLEDGTAAPVLGLRDMPSAEILPSLEAAERLWRSLEATPECLATPYQQFAWTEAYLRETGEIAAARVMVLRDRVGRPRILLPFVVRRRHGLALACSVGDAHANYHLPLFAGRDAAAIPPEDVRAAMVAAVRFSGIDAFAFTHQPRIWEGSFNPLAVGGVPDASAAYGLVLGPDPEATVRRAFSAESRKKLRSKEKRLVEAFGPIAYCRAENSGEAQAFLRAFYTQKSARFACMGIGDPYAPETIRRFLDRASAGAEPVVELYALRVQATGRILAVFGGAVNDTRFSGMMTSFDTDPAVSRFSPGDLLLHHLVVDQAARGRLGFDLGIGEARYKASICDETILLVDTLWPVTVRGAAYCMACLGFRQLKRRIKGDPRLFAVASRVRTAVKCLR